MHNVEASGENDPERSFLVNRRRITKRRQDLQYLERVPCPCKHRLRFRRRKKTALCGTDAPSTSATFTATPSFPASTLSNLRHHTAPFFACPGFMAVTPAAPRAAVISFAPMIQLSADREEVRVVDDEILTPTFTEDIAVETALLLEHTSHGDCSTPPPKALVRGISLLKREHFKRLGREHKLRKATASEFPAKVRRPLYSVLDNAHLRALHLDIMPQWQDGLDRYLGKIL